MAKQKHPGRKRRLQSSPRYSSRIIKAGALIGDTKTLLSCWDVTVSVAENMDRVQRENVFGKASRSHGEDILAIFRQPGANSANGRTIVAAGTLILVLPKFKNHR